MRQPNTDHHFTTMFTTQTDVLQDYDAVSSKVTLQWLWI